MRIFTWMPLNRPSKIYCPKTASDLWMKTKIAYELVLGMHLKLQVFVVSVLLILMSSIPPSNFGSDSGSVS